MRGDDHAELTRQRQRAVQLRVVDAEGPLVGEEDLEGRDALLHDLAQLPGRGVVEAGHAHVKRVVAGGPAGALLGPDAETLRRIGVARGAAHVEDGRRPADEGGAAGGLIIVLGERAHERQVNVRVGVDETWKNVFARGINDLRAGGSGQTRGRSA